MKKSTVKEIIIPALSLFLICAVATALLGFTNKITEPKIEQLAAETQMKAKQEVLSEASEFSDEMTAELDGTAYSYYEGTKDGKTVGYVFATSAKGYGGDIDIMVGIDTEGKVTGIEILEIEETPGLGMNAKTDPVFVPSFVGKDGHITLIKNGTPSDNEVVAMTGATITSTAITKAVNIALDLYSTAGGENNG